MDTQGVVGEYMYGHTGDNGGSTCMDTLGIVGEYMYGHTTD